MLFDGTWGRRAFIQEIDSYTDDVWQSMSIEERNSLLGLRDAFIGQLTAEIGF